MGFILIVAGVRYALMKAEKIGFEEVIRAMFSDDS
jgi:hypothetical protein